MKITRFVHYVLQIIDSQLSIIFLGNGSGLSKNIHGAYMLNRCRRSRGLELKRQHGLNPALADLRQEGAVFLNGSFLQQDALNALREGFQKAIDDPLRSEPAPVAEAMGVPFACRQILKAADLIPNIESLLTPSLIELLDNFYRCEYRIHTVSAFRTRGYAKKQQRLDAFSDNWHFDRVPSCNLQLLIYLNDSVNRETGAFRLHGMTGTKKLVKFGFVRGLVSKKVLANLEAAESLKVFEGDIGDCALFRNAVCAHRAGVPREGSYRDAIILGFQPLTHPGRDITPSEFRMS